MFTKLRNLYYKIKYSNLKSNAGAVGVIIGNKKDKDDFNARIEEIAARTSPCYKTNDEVLAYIREKYNLTQITPSRSAVANYKVNYIMNVCPEVLKTPEYKLPDGNKSPSRKQMQAFHENSNKRFSEALDYPMEKLGIELECIVLAFTVFSYALGGEKGIHDVIFCHRNNGGSSVYDCFLCIYDAAEGVDGASFVPLLCKVKGHGIAAVEDKAVIGAKIAEINPV